PGPQAGWTPPPRPGLIPLRPLTLGTILGASFQVLRRNPRPTFGLSLLVSGATYILGLGVVAVVGFLAFSRVASATGADADAIAAGAGGLTLVSALIPVALAIIGTALLQGIVALEVARGTLGEKLTLRGLFAGAKGRIGALIGWTLLLTGAIILSIAIVAGLIALIAVVGGAAGAVIGVLLGILLGLGLVVLYAWLSTKLAMVPSVLMLERVTLRQAIARSWSLTNGSFWKTLGILLLVAVILQTAASIVSAPFSFVFGIGGVLINPTGDEGALIATFIVTYVLLLLLSVVFGALAAVVQSATPALLYIDLRMRKEGLDLELNRFVEARQAGDTSVTDPYLVRAGGATAAPAPGAPWS
ncbi:MAG TPA: hypothetical protein VN200_08240, partial [Rhodoglobus sp.]|nr:hypothetical protein [Rhodoglobus sp.]